MGSLHDNDGPIEPTKANSHYDFTRAETRIFDSQFSPPLSLGERVEDGNGDQMHFKDAYETQALNLDGETQALNLDFETQTLNLDFETQALNLDFETQTLNLDFETQALNLDNEPLTWNVGDETQALDCFDDIQIMGTQLLDVSDNQFANHSDHEGSDKTEILGGGGGISDDDSARRGSKQSLRKEKMHSSTICEQEPHDSTATLVVQVTPQPEPESVPRFTSIRAASLRASGLAAHSMASKEINSESCYFPTDGLFSDQDSVRNNGLGPKVTEETDHICDLKDGEKDKGLRNGNKCRIGSSAVRKLFTEDPLPADKGTSDYSKNADGGENLLQCLQNDGELGGLSYIDSQEPGELSQANALKFVEMFIEKSSFFEFDHEDNHGKSTGGKSKPVSTAKGSQTLAKKSNDRNIIGKTGIFDWDDSREDEGGGDIFCRRKKEFCDARCCMQRPSTAPRKLIKRKLDAFRYDKEQAGAHDKIMICSDSKVTLHNIKKNEKKAEDTLMRLEKNLVNEFDEELNAESVRRQTETDIDKIDLPQISNVGPDTQMAAEAMEALLSGAGIANHNVNCFQSDSDWSAEGSSRGKSMSNFSLKQSSSQKMLRFSDVGVATRQNKKTKRTGAKLCRGSQVSSVTNFKNIRKKCDKELEIKKKRRAKSMTKGNSPISGNKNADEGPSETIGLTVEERILKSSRSKEVNGCVGTATQNAAHSIKKQKLIEGLSTCTPIACRTRRSMLASQSKGPVHIPENSVEDANHLLEAVALEENRTGSTDGDMSEMYAKKKHSKLGSNQSREVENSGPDQPEQLDQELTAMSTGVYTFSYPRRRRSCQNLSAWVRGYDKLDAQSKPSLQPEDIRQSITGHKGSRSNNTSISVSLAIKRKTRSSVHGCASLSSLDRSMERNLSEKIINKPGPKDASVDCGSAGMNGKVKSAENIQQKALNHSERKSVIDPQPPAGNAEINSRLDKSPREQSTASDSACTSSPVNCLTPVNAASPVCMGNEFSYKRNLSKSCLVKELSMLIATEQEPISPLKELRKRRDMTSIRVLFSHHLDDDIIKQQKKILARLGASVATSITDATHFVTDNFVRTRNMLEAIASGKPVVTHLWLESIGQVKVHIDEEAYLLRDTKKEKEFGFSMPASLARARKHPLLQGRRVLITQNIKPSEETIKTLVKAVHGQAVERIGRSALKGDKVPGDLLILSCEEDYKICEPFLEKGAAVYSSELLLNGIVTQKLEYERHRLFADNVKRTRSTIWLKKDGLKFHPVTKLK